MFEVWGLVFTFWILAVSFSGLRKSIEYLDEARVFMSLLVFTISFALLISAGLVWTISLKEQNANVNAGQFQTDSHRR